MKHLIALLLIATLPLASFAAAEPDTPHARKTLEIFTTIVEMETAKGLGNVPAMADYLAGELRAAGFGQQDIEVIPRGETAVFVARYRGDGSSDNKPILLLGHMDVVGAKPEDWERPPFTLTRDERFFYARGTIDNKMGIAHMVSTFIRLRQEGFVPNRDIIIALTGDEETGMATTRYLAYERPDLAEAAYALNSDAGGGVLNDKDEAAIYLIQAAEKTFATWEITARNPGGHSSRPRADNAIYDLADAIGRIRAYQFPVQSNALTRAYLAETGAQIGGELGASLQRFAADPSDSEAAARLAIEPVYVGATRTTCVVTMLRAGHAENALPQSATATVNCRIFPGVDPDEVKATLQQVIANPALEFQHIGAPISASPVSEMRPEVLAAVSKAVHSRFPGVPVVPYMTAGGTDGKHFRKAGIPTFAVSGRFMQNKDITAHGLNERVTLDAFYGALDHWSIILRELAGDGWPQQ